ncbi:hypothetical protein CRG98_028303, partial [Punica granatum]
MLKSWLGSLLISLFGMVSQNGVLTFDEPAPSCHLQPCRVCSPVRVYFSASQVRRACSLVPLAILPSLFTLASLLFGFACSPSLLARASCNLAGSAHLCEFTFLLRKFTEPARSCLLQPCRACCHVRVYFSLRKFADPARPCILQPCRVCTPLRVYFSASQVRRACSLVPLATLPVLLTCASLLFCFASSPSLLARAYCNLAGPAVTCEFTFRFASSPTLLARASCNLAVSAHPCEFTFLLRKFAEPARSCLLQPCRFCSLVRVYFSASQVHRACSLVPIATLPGLLSRASLLFASQVRRPCSPVHLATLPCLHTPASLLFCFASSPSLLARASCNLAGSAHLCEFTFLLRKFTEPARSCLLQPCRACCHVRVYFSLRKFADPARPCILQPCRVCTPLRVYFSASQVRRACSLVPLATLPVLLTCASLLFCFASSPSLLARAYCNLAGPAVTCEFTFRFASSPTLLARASCNLAVSAHPCEFTFLLRKFAEPARSCLLQPCRFCSLVRVYFSASQVHRACSLVPIATLPGLLSRASLLFASQVRRPCSPVHLATLPCLHTPASLLFCFASSPSLLARASCNLAGSAHLCEFTFLLRKFTEPARSCLLQPCRACCHVRVYFSLRKFADPARPCILQPCRVCTPLRVYFSASQVRRACSLVPLATLPVLLTCASLLFCFASSPSLLARAYCNLAGPAVTCEFTFRFASSPTLLARASCNLAVSAHPCEFTFLLRKFAEPAHSCLLQPCRVCSPVRVYFSTSQVRRASSLVPIATLPGLLTRASLLLCFASSPSLLARASCNLARSAHTCEFTFLLRRFAEPARSCLLQPCRVCSPVRVYFSTSQVRRAYTLVPLAILPSLFTRASFLFGFACSPSLLARASCNLAGSAHPCEFTFPLPKFAEPTRSCLLQSCRVCSPVQVSFSASHVHRACSLVPLATLPGLLSRASLLYASQVRRACSSVPLATLPGLLTRASLLLCFASSPSLLVGASCNLAGSAHPCEFTFWLRKFAEPARSCLIQPCRVCSAVRVYFYASQVRRACSLVHLAILP